jgi:hypothetical protein
MILRSAIFPLTRRIPGALAVLFGLLGAPGGSSCASTPGDDVTCPSCDGTTELLVGTKCVPIASVAACGPDGHAHGDSCHCSSGQQPTRIGAVEYCLQQGCGEAKVDTDAAACAEVTLAAEAISAAERAADVETAHVALAKVAEVALPASQESYVHFGADEAGEFLVYATLPGVVIGAQSEAGAALALAIEGPNEDCGAVLPEVTAVTTKGAGPVLLRLKAGTIPKVKLVIYESAHVH